MYDAKASYICAGETGGQHMKLINTQVPVTLTVAPALRKGTQTSKERVRTIPEQSQPQPDSPQKAVAIGHVWGSRTARAGDAVSSNTGLFVTSGCKL